MLVASGELRTVNEERTKTYFVYCLDWLENRLEALPPWMIEYIGVLDVSSPPGYTHNLLVRIISTYMYLWNIDAYILTHIFHMCMHIQFMPVALIWWHSVVWYCIKRTKQHALCIWLIEDQVFARESAHGITSIHQRGYHDCSKIIIYRHDVGGTLFMEKPNDQNTHVYANCR